MRELVLKYPPSYIADYVGTNKASPYYWISGKSSPKFKRYKNKLTELSKTLDRSNNLVRNSKKKEKLLIFLSEKPKTELINGTLFINTIPVIFPEIKRRESKTSNTWYINEINKNSISIHYFNSRGKWKTVSMPLRLEFTAELASVLGFWFGDGVTKNPKNLVFRPYISFSVSEFSTLSHIREFFLKLDNSDHVYLEIIKGRFCDNERLEKFIKQVESMNVCFNIRDQGEWNSLGTSFHIRNVALAYLFEFFKNNIDELLNNSKVKSAFLAGYFTAEGNVSKINQHFSFNETKHERRLLIKNLLKDLGFKDIYEFKEKITIGYKNSIRDLHFILFKELILPHIFSKEKIKSSNELLKGNNLRDIDLIYLFYLYLHPNSVSRDIAKDFSKNEDYINKVFRRLEESTIPLVTRNRSKKRTEFAKFNLTKKGEMTVLSNSHTIKNILVEIRRTHKFNRGFRGAFYLKDHLEKPYSAINEMIEYFNM